jgi:hypothetical protein
MPTNMDTNKNKEATAPVFEFSLPKSEMDTPLQVGDNGHVIIPVNVLEISDGMVTLRKNGPVKTLDFKEETVESMRERMGVVKDEEMDMKECEDCGEKSCECDESEDEDEE